MITSTKQPACPVCDPPPPRSSSLQLLPSSRKGGRLTSVLSFFLLLNWKRPKCWMFRLICVSDSESGASVAVRTRSQTCHRAALECITSAVSHLRLSINPT